MIVMKKWFKRQLDNVFEYMDLPKLFLLGSVTALIIVLVIAGLVYLIRALL